MTTAEEWWSESKDIFFSKKNGTETQKAVPKKGDKWFRVELIESRKEEREAKRIKKESQQKELIDEISMVGLWQMEEVVWQR